MANTQQQFQSRPSGNIAEHAAMRLRPGSPQSGGDIGGPKKFLGGKGIPTSGGASKSHFATDRTNDQGGKRLYLGKAFENAQRPPFTRVSGNSKGVAEVASKTESDATIKKAAQNRLASGKAEAMESRRKATGVEMSGNIFRREGEAFGPQRADQRSKGKDHGEFMGFPARRIEKGPIKAHRSTA